MDLITGLQRMQIGGTRMPRRTNQMTTSSGPINLDFALPKYEVAADYLFEIDYDKGPPLACHLHPGRGLLATSNECGRVVVLDALNLQARKKGSDEDGFNDNRMPPVCTWMAHNNAIFDFQWISDGYSASNIITAAGDQSLALWDINNLDEPIFEVAGAHKSSIRSVSVCRGPGDSNIFVTGARDGAIKLWDVRCLNGGSIGMIVDAHNRMHSNPSASKRRSSTSKNSIYPARSDPSSSVSFVLFDSYNPNRFYSSGANDGCVKMWDTRCMRNKQPQLGKKVASKVYRYIGATSSSNFHGFSSLAQSRDILFACCSDGTIYGYPLDIDDSSVDPSKVLRFNGHQVNNYTKINVLADRYLISGSTNGRAYAWTFDSKSLADNQNSNHMIVHKPTIYLPHGEEDVSAVEVEPTTRAIFTCSDDKRIVKWSLGKDPRALRTKPSSSSQALDVVDARPLGALDYAQEWGGEKCELLPLPHLKTPKTQNESLRPSSSTKITLLGWARPSPSPSLDQLSSKKVPKESPKTPSKAAAHGSATPTRNSSQEANEKVSRGVKRPLQESVVHSPSKLNVISSLPQNEFSASKRFQAETPSPSDISKGKWKLKTPKSGHRKQIMSACRKIDSFFSPAPPKTTAI